MIDESELYYVWSYHEVLNRIISPERIHSWTKGHNPKPNWWGRQAYVFRSSEDCAWCIARECIKELM